MDDIHNSTKGVQEVREANKKVNIIMKKIDLCLNKDTSVCVVIGSTKQKLSITQYLKDQPLLCGEKETKDKQQVKWLGQIMSANGLADSVAFTIADKEGKIRGASLKIAIIRNDWRAKDLGGFETVIMLWEKCCILSLMQGAGIWIEIDSATEKRLNYL